MAEKLTPQQAEAVHNRGGKLLVSAAAGSGKTKVLVDRLLGFITDPIKPANVDDFLIITYTKAAAAELRGKIAVKLAEHIALHPDNRHLQRQMQRLYLAKISTVHAFCGDLLREFSYQLDIPAGFRVADETECVVLRQRVLEDMLNSAYAQEEQDTDFLAFMETQGLGRTDRFVPEIIQRVYDSSRCHLNPEQWLEKCIYDADVRGVTDVSMTLYGRFLMDDLFHYLDLQIQVLKECAAAAVMDVQMVKPIALLQSTVQQLEDLRASCTWDEIVQKRKIDYGRLVFPKKMDDPLLAMRIKSIRSACKNGLEKKLASFADTSTQTLDDLKQSKPALSGMIAMVKRFTEEYARIKKNRRILDFSDLEHKTLDLFLGKNRSTVTTTANEVGERFREIMVDEYQDSNVVQDAIFSALTHKRKNLFMVGDVKQSIYQFRLADPGIFLDKYSSFISAAEAVEGQGRKVLLSSNFRSGGGVISAVNDVFVDCMSPEVGGLNYSDEEALREGIPHVPLHEEEVEFHAIQVQTDTYAEEASFVADRILQLLDGTHMVRQGDVLRAIVPDDIVILLRSPGSVGHHFQSALQHRGIRCVTGGGIDLLQTEEISTLRSLLQTLSNPQQDIPLASVLASPILGFTADDLAAVRAGNRYCSFYEALRNAQNEKSRIACNMIQTLRNDAKINTVTGLIERVILLTKIDAIYATFDGGETRRANLQTFFQLASEFEARGGRGLEGFLNYLQSLDEKGLVIGGESSGTGAVTIMSIHKSKGLEFPVTFLCGLSRSFNREDLRAQVICHKDMGIGLSCIDLANRVRYPTIAKRAIATKTAMDSLSEELRVLYVAMTRARDRLIMTYASSSLESDVQEIVSRMEYGDRTSLTSDVSCPGEWVLYSALKRIEAGELFAISERPVNLRISDHPWKITVNDSIVAKHIGHVAPGIEEVTNTSNDVDFTVLDFQYPYVGATTAPSKLTATQKKGRIKDQEAAQDAQIVVSSESVWRKPSFLQAKKSGKEYGKAMHCVLQHVRFEVCSDTASVKQEIDRLVLVGCITQEVADMVDCSKIAAFCQTGVGQRLCQGTNVLREFKFSLLENASTVDPTLDGEMILLQGVVDCALIEDDGITVIDFKTDFVTEDSICDKARQYNQQIQTYATALSRIYKTSVKACYLYFFHLNRLIPVRI